MEITSAPHTDETEASRLWDSERRSSPFSTVADVEDEYCDSCGDAHDCTDCIDCIDDVDRVVAA